MTQKPRPWTSEDFSKAGAFGPFLESFDTILEKGDIEIEDTAANLPYFSPVASHTRSRVVHPATPSKPPKLKDTSIEAGIEKLILNEFMQTPDTKGSFANTPSSTSLAPTSDSSNDFYSPEEARKREDLVADESTVNTCFLALLQPLLWSFGISKTVGSAKQRFECNFGEAQFVACVDGVIMYGEPSQASSRPEDGVQGEQSRASGGSKGYNVGTDPEQVTGLVEVKRAPRSPLARLQEAAETVAFIASGKYIKGETRLVCCFLRHFEGPGTHGAPAAHWSTLPFLTILSVRFGICLITC